MSIRDFHEKLKAEDKDELFVALGDLRQVDDVSRAVAALMWPDMW